MSKRRIAVLAIVPLLIATGLAIWSLPGNSAQPTPVQTPFSGYTTGTAVHVDALQAGLTGPQLANAEVAFAGATVASQGTNTVNQGSPPLSGLNHVVNEMSQEVQPNLPDGSPFLQGNRSFARGAGLEVGLGQNLPANAPQIPINTVKVSAPAVVPCPTTPPATGPSSGPSPLPAASNSTPATTPPACFDVKQIGPIPLNPVAFASLLKGEGFANWRNDVCVVPFSQGTGEATRVQLLNSGGTLPDGQFINPTLSVDSNNQGPDRDVSRTRSIMYTAAASAVFSPTAPGNPAAITDPRRVLVAETRETIAPVTLARGTPSSVTIEVLGEWVLRAIAAGRPNGAAVQYTPVDPASGQPLDASAPVIRIVPAVGAPTVILAAQALAGLSITLPGGAGPQLLELSIGEPPHRIGDPSLPPQIDTANGTLAAAAVDVVRVRALVAPPQLVHLADLRIGHMESRAQVPIGGPACPPPQADLSIIKTHSPAQFPQGGIGTYNIRVNNGGPSPTPDPCPTGVTPPGPSDFPCGTPTVVTDTLPSGTTFQSAAGNGWTCTANGQVVTCTNPIPIPSGSGSDLAINVNVTNTPSLAQCALNNVATVRNAGISQTPQGNPPMAPDPPGNNTASDAAQISGPGCPAGPNVSISKTHSPTSFPAGGQGTYTITVSNAATNSTPVNAPITVTDTLPSGISFASGTGGGFTCTANGQIVTCNRPAASATVPPLAPGGSLTITLTVNVTATPNAQQCVATNNARVETANNQNANPTATDRHRIIGDAAGVCSAGVGPDLSITKTHSPTTFTPGSTATYTLTVTNVGTAATTGPTTVTDTLPTGVTFVSGNGLGTCTAAGQTVTCTNGGNPNAPPASLLPGGSFTLTLTVNVAASCTGTLNNTATVENASDTNPANNTSNVDTTTCGGQGPDFSVTKTHSPQTFNPGGTGTVTITVVNNGPVASTGTVQTLDTLPTGLTFTSAATTNGFSCSANGQAVTCSTTQSLPIGTYTIILNVAIAPGFTGGTNQVVVSAVGDPNLANNTATDFIPAAQVVAQDLAIVKSHSPSTFTAGQQGAFFLTVSNVGTTNSSGTITVTDTLPFGLTPTTAQGSGWTCSISGQSVTCTTTSVLTPATQTTITVFVTIAPNVAGIATNTGVLNPSDNNPGNNTSTDQVAINGQQQQQAFCQTQGQMVIAPRQSNSSNQQEEQQSVQRPGSDGKYRTSQSQEQEQSRTNQGVTFSQDQCGNTVIAPYQSNSYSSQRSQQQQQSIGTGGGTSGTGATWASTPTTQSGSRVQSQSLPTYGTGGPSAPAAPPAQAVSAYPRFTG